MKKVMQTKFQSGKGNCFNACIASILDIDINDVPDFLDDDTWCEDVNEWLRENFELVVLWVQAKPDVHILEEEYGIRHIMSGYSNLGKDELHAVVAIDGQMFYDPNPYSNGLEEVLHYGFLVRV